MPKQNRLYIEDSEEVRDLSHTESRVLLFLLSEPGVTRSRDEIMRFAWEGRVVTMTSINLAVFSLRTALDDGDHREVIQTVARKGYRFNPVSLHSMAEDDTAASGAAGVRPVEGSVSNESSSGASSLWSRLGKSDAQDWGWRVLAVGSLAGLLVLALLYRIDLWLPLYLSSRFVQESVRFNDLEVHLVDSNAARLAAMKRLVLPVLQSGELSGKADVWVNHKGGAYQIICASDERIPVEIVIGGRAPSGDELRDQLAVCLGGVR
ncbi:winged helix-turn-helix domain-containing protein [Pseudomonas sp. PDNC002]|uniref:winged helix-turn-helix domain-containing protein n=1 Tax=Pseudomonas sp. PDNC002 TaxID=2811422 RepID=UPI001F06ECDF|nr:winged helix-turn-helix domain-containing protein [Pseudomonas sp. PDNC002]